MPGGPWGQQGTNKFLDAAARELDLMGYDISVIYGDSGAEWVFEAALKGGRFDAIFIDGDHSIEGVSRDWRIYGDHGKLVAFHDIAGDDIIHKTSGPVEVPLFWADISARYETIEFVGAERGFGIGVVLR